MSWQTIVHISKLLTYIQKLLVWIDEAKLYKTSIYKMVYRY